MLLDEIKQIKTDRLALRKFGLLVGGVLAVLGILFLVRGRAHYPYFLAPGAALIVLGLMLPGILKQIYIAWMALAIVLGFIVSHAILTLFFFLVITPIGLTARLFGKDFLRLRLQRQAPTYWLPRERRGPKTPADYERQF